MIPRPLKPHYFQILLALAGGELHGYAIQRAVLQQTDEGVRLWPALLYRSLAKLEASDLIAQAEPPENQPDDERRHYYAITGAGRERLEEEATMLSRWAAAARESAS